MLESIYRMRVKLFCNHVFDVKHFLIKQPFAILYDSIYLHYILSKHDTYRIFCKWSIKYVLANYRFSFIMWMKKQCSSLSACFIF